MVAGTLYRALMLSGRGPSQQIVFYPGGRRPRDTVLAGNDIAGCFGRRTIDGPLNSRQAYTEVNGSYIFDIVVSILTQISLNCTGTGSVTQSNLLVKIVDLLYTATGSSSINTLKAFTEVLTQAGIGTSSVVKQVGKVLNATATGASTEQKQVGLTRVFSAIGTSLYADTVSFGRTLLHTGLGVLAMTKSFIGGGGGTVSTLIRRGKFIMNKFGRW